MSDEHPSDDPGLFGKLPRSRPGTRSPRRAGSAAGEAEPKPVTRKRAPARPRPAAARPKPKPPPKREPVAAAKRPEPAPKAKSEPERADLPQDGAGLEELAWAGIAVTAEAATLGVRLVTRALDAARRATER